MSARRAAGEKGFALILAVLALMLLTFLGLSLAATTSMDLQSAANYRWSKQAYYDAEGGLEVGRAALRSMSWVTVLPSARLAPWFPDGTVQTPVAPYTRATRNFENAGCDRLGAGAGNGVVLDDGTSSSPWEDRTRLLGQDLTGAVTLWIRRPLVSNPDGTWNDEPDSDVLILTAEGVAPFGNAAVSARRRLEARLRRIPSGGGWDVVVESVRLNSTVCS